MEFETLVSSLDAEALAHAAEALLRALSGGAGEGALSLPASAPSAGRERRAPGSPPLSASGRVRPLPGTEGAEINDLTAAGDFSSSFAAVPGGEAAEETAGAALRAPRPDADSKRKPRSTGAEAAARLEERLAVVPARNRRSLGAGAEAVSPYAYADGPVTEGAAGAGPEPFSSFPAPRAAAGPRAEALPGEADTETAPRAGGAAVRDYFDAEAVSDFFRRDSRRYDSGFTD